MLGLPLQSVWLKNGSPKNWLVFHRIWSWFNTPRCRISGNQSWNSDLSSHIHLFLSNPNVWDVGWKRQDWPRCPNTFEGGRISDFYPKVTRSNKSGRIYIYKYSYKYEIITNIKRIVEPLSHSVHLPSTILKRLKGFGPSFSLNISDKFLNDI